MEAKPLKLTAAQFPFPCSLQTVVTSLYASDHTSEQIMPLEELLHYLKNIDQFDVGPVAAVLAQTEAIGDPAVPSPDHRAKMEWVEVAFSRWQEYFPLDPSLARELRKLLPLGAALAITDPEFMTPGAHCFHQLLDTMQEAAVGWQASPNGAVRGLAGEIQRVIASACRWHEGANADLAALLTQLKTAAAKDRGRARRMAQRVVEAEQGKQKATRAKLTAATMINTLLEEYPATSDIGHFLKGPWYESAQLLLLKYGAQSDQWTQMSRVSALLLDSLQATEAPNTEEAQDEGPRQQLFETITRLPKELKRWLLSLQHDTDGVSRAISAIEDAHMQVLRQQALQLESIPLIVIREALAPQESSEVQDHIDNIDVGQWFLVAPAKKTPERVQLALKIETDQQLLFTNYMGTKAMQHGYAYFVALLTGGQASPLSKGLSFSRSLAHAAEIRSPGDMTILSGLIAERAAQDKAARAQDDDLEAQRIRQEYNEAVEAQRERDETQQRLQARSTSAGHSNTPSKLHINREARAEEEQFDELDLDLTTDESPTTECSISDQSNQPTSAADSGTGDVELPGPLDTGSADQLSHFDLEIPIGTWMGFHDGDKPLMAKMAAHDKKRDSYIFVNREGMKMRDLNKLELVTLLDEGLIDMLETRANFRDEITRVRQKFEE